MADEMLNKTTAYKGSGIQGIGDSIELMKEFDMNKLNDSINPKDSGKTKVSEFHKNS